MRRLPLSALDEIFVTFTASCGTPTLVAIEFATSLLSESVAALPTTSAKPTLTFAVSSVVGARLGLAVGRDDGSGSGEPVGAGRGT